jgi:hypothetical protein
MITVESSTPGHRGLGRGALHIPMDPKGERTSVSEQGEGARAGVSAGVAAADGGQMLGICGRVWGGSERVSRPRRGLNIEH